MIFLAKPTSVDFWSWEDVLGMTGCFKGGFDKVKVVVRVVFFEVDASLDLGMMAGVACLGVDFNVMSDSLFSQIDDGDSGNKYLGGSKLILILSSENDGEDGIDVKLLSFILVSGAIFFF